MDVFGVCVHLRTWLKVCGGQRRCWMSIFIFYCIWGRAPVVCHCEHQVICLLNVPSISCSHLLSHWKRTWIIDIYWSFWLYKCSGDLNPGRHAGTATALSIDHFLQPKHLVKGFMMGPGERAQQLRTLAPLFRTSRVPFPAPMSGSSQRTWDPLLVSELTHTQVYRYIHIDTCTFP